MPTLVWLYLTAVLYDRSSARGVALAEALETVSHDRLTRMLQGHWPGHTLLERALHTLFVWEQGDLIRDDTVIPQPFATAIEGLAWVFSRQERQPVYGLALVWLVWTNGSLRIPLGMRLWRKGGPSKDDLALERRSSARNRLRGHPDEVVFDAWYPSRALLKRLRDDGWYFVCRLKKHRRFNARPLRISRRHPSWAERGWLSGGLKVLVVRHGKQVLRHQSPDPSGRGSASTLSRSLPQSGNHQSVSGSTRPAWLSSPLRASAATSHHRLVGRLLRAGVRTTGAATEHVETQAAAQCPRPHSGAPSSGTAKKRCVTPAGSS
jgi:Transposase DDE domain